MVQKLGGPKIDRSKIHRSKIRRVQKSDGPKFWGSKNPGGVQNHRILGLKSPVFPMTPLKTGQKRSIWGSKWTVYGVPRTVYYQTEKPPNVLQNTSCVAMHFAQTFQTLRSNFRPRKTRFLGVQNHLRFWDPKSGVGKSGGVQKLDHPKFGVPNRDIPKTRI